jgi:hypothetical protein
MAGTKPPTQHSKESVKIAPVRTAAEPQPATDHDLIMPSIALMETQRELPGATILRQNNMMALQRLVGNSAVQRLMIQREDEEADADASDAEAEKKRVEREEFQKGVSTPVPIDAVIGGGKATVEVGGAIVTIMPDGKSTDEKLEGMAVTSGGITGWGTPGYVTGEDGKIESFDEIQTPKVSIQTVYGPKAKASDTSSYGRGTTAEDKKAGNTSLGFHEGMHGKTTLDYLKNKPLPEFGGAIGDSEADFKKARNKYKKKMKAAEVELQKLQFSKVDCVGDEADFCKADDEDEHEH